jgi:hypothetical protein
MKNILPRILLTIAFMLFTASLNLSVSQAPPPPPAGGTSGGHDLGGNQGPGGGASINGGLGMSLLLIAGYGGYILYRSRKKKNQINAGSE